MTYQEFLKTKELTIEPCGFDCDERNPKLFDWQNDVVRWALRKGKCAIFTGCGSGKTRMQLQWAQKVHEHTGQPVLILCPLAVAQQTKREGVACDIEVTVVRNQGQCVNGINVTNYEMLPHFEPDKFSGVVLDECFAPDTIIETVDSNGCIVEKEIKDIVPGDIVRNCTGIDEVTAVRRKKVPYGIKIGFNGRQIICSPRHPFFTERGWVCAKELRKTDRIVSTDEALRLVREGFPGLLSFTGSEKILREILFCEMENEPTGNQGEGSHGGSSSKDWEESIRLVANDRKRSKKRREDKESQPVEKPGNAGENFGCIEGDSPRTFKAWGKWNRDDLATAIDDGCIARKLGGGIVYLSGEENARIPDELQGRLRELSNEDCNRTGWELTLREKRARQEEGRKTGFYGLESFEVLEPGCSELDQYRDASGSLYFCDIEIKRHPSFTVNGCLVHNSSILKQKMGKTSLSLRELFERTPFKLCCTATPAPNDFMELGTHAEFLGVMKQTEMLATFFVHDGGETQKWRLKGHAEKKFFEWVAGWACCFERPQDIGYDDAGYDLPELRVHEVSVESTDTVLADGQVMMFAPVGSTLLERRSARRNSLEDRVAKAAEIANGTDDQVLVWCDLNSESKALSESIRDCVEVEGSMPLEQKENGIISFLDGGKKCLVSKASICGWGLNAQNCHKMIFVGLSDSFEAYYQAVRRCWRFGQKYPVDVYIVISDAEGNVKKNIERKQADAERMVAELVKQTKERLMSDLHSTKRDVDEYYAFEEMEVPEWLKMAN